MSVQAAVNGAQRDIGLYTGIDGAVRALNGCSELKSEIQTDIGSIVDIAFDISDVTFALMLGRCSFSNMPEQPMIDNISGLNDRNTSFILVINGKELYALESNVICRYENGEVGMSHSNGGQKYLACTLYWF